MFIDIHIHACKVATTAFNGRQVCSTPEQILPIYDERNIERGHDYLDDALRRGAAARSVPDWVLMIFCASR